MNNNLNLLIVEGPDGSGKTTFCKSIAEANNGIYVHSTYWKGMNAYQYHIKQLRDSITEAQLNDKNLIVMDRLFLSEGVYGDVFRDGPSYDVDAFYNFIRNKLQAFDFSRKIYTTFIYCKPPKDFLLANWGNKAEMFDKIEPVYERYEWYMKCGYDKIFTKYDYTKETAQQFYNKIKKGN